MHSVGVLNVSPMQTKEHSQNLPWRTVSATTTANAAATAFVVVVVVVVVFVGLLFGYFPSPAYQRRRLCFLTSDSRDPNKRIEGEKTNRLSGIPIYFYDSVTLDAQQSLTYASLVVGERRRRR